MIDLQETIGSLKTEFDAKASAVISRDGLLIASDLPENITAETFTIMCATMMGAASTAHSECGIGQPKVMRVISDEHEMVIVGAGRRALVISVVPLGTNNEKLLEKLNMIMNMVNSD